MDSATPHASRDIAEGRPDGLLSRETPKGAPPPSESACSPPRAAPAALHSLSFLLPLLAAGFSVAVLMYCVQLSKMHGHIPTTIRTPPLSLAGIHAPEYFYFSSGFVAMSVLLVACEHLFFSALAPYLPLLSAEEEAELGLTSSRGTVRLGFLGLALTGVLPLQGWGSACSLAHVLASLAFFMCSIQYGFKMSHALCSPKLDALPVHYRNAPLLWYVKCGFLANCFLSFIPAQVLHPGGTPLKPHLGGQEAAEIDAGGFSQWWMVGSLILYFTCYSADIFILERSKKGCGK